MIKVPIYRVLVSKNAKLKFILKNIISNETSVID